ncbi:MAG: hypothetical protein LKI80_16630 [Sporolactobacillus sp.]|jgi:hypothetical protein|nr:hypothetical protein [Sporolactobacillus sp.]
MIGLRKSDILFNHVYDALVVNNQENDEYTIDLTNHGKRTIRELKAMLRDDEIKYEENGLDLICFLDKERKKFAKEIYTPEVRKKLIEEQNELDKDFAREFATSKEELK